MKLDARMPRYGVGRRACGRCRICPIDPRDVGRTEAVIGSTRDRLRGCGLHREDRPRPFPAAAAADRSFPR